MHFAKASSTFTRKELIIAMRAAPSYFKESYVSNLSVSLKRLVVDETLREIGTDTFALSAKTISDLEPKLRAA